MQRNQLCWRYTQYVGINNIMALSHPQFVLQRLIKTDVLGISHNEVNVCLAF